jgi:hypothetical protein
MVSSGGSDGVTLVDDVISRDDITSSDNATFSINASLFFSVITSIPDDVIF